MLNSFWWGNNEEASKGIKWMRWEKLCIHKGAGGRGFRDLHLFNIALLAKIGWRLISDPSALVCRILKEKYFPNTGFLDAVLGRNPSFTWTSIHAAEDLLRMGVRWKVGDGNNIRVWGSPWLNNDDDFYVRTPVIEGVEDLLVSDLLIPGTRLWDRQLLEQHFIQRDVDAILRTPRSPEGFNDQIIWAMDRKGAYTVKTGYRLTASLVANNDWIELGNWNALWNLKSLPKVKDCLWRICRNVLPNKDNLFSKKVVNDKWCIMCGKDIETSWHLFFSCDFAMKCWEVARLSDTIESNIRSVESLKDMILSLLSKSTAKIAHTVAILIWGIWKQRNMMLWEGRHDPPEKAVSLVITLQSEWERTCLSTVMTDKSLKCSAWHRPPVNALKVNIDAAFFSDTMSMGIEMVLRDANGTFVAARTLVLPGMVPADVGEAMGFVEALSWVKGMKLENVIVEGDARLVVDAIDSSERNCSSFGDYIELCKSILRSCPSYSISCVRRCANSIAHALARESRSFESPFCWVDLPSFVARLPADVCSCIL